MKYSSGLEQCFLKKTTEKLFEAISAVATGFPFNILACKNTLFDYKGDFLMHEKHETTTLEKSTWFIRILILLDCNSLF